MKTNLKWIDQEYRRWRTDKPEQFNDTDWNNIRDVEGTIQLFAAFCIERLYIEEQAGLS